MSDDTVQKVRGIEFYSVEVQNPPLPDPGEPWVDMIYRNEDDKRVYEAAFPTVLATQKNAFVDFADMPLNMIVTEFDPNHVLPQHSHAEDCLYYIERGEIVMGSRRMGPGEGFLVRADQPYAYTAGPEGVRVLEIRHQPMDPPNFSLREKDVPAWSQRFFDALGQPVPSS